MIKYFIVSDIHGYYNLFIAELFAKGFKIDNPNHILISCGDLLDRGFQPRQCLQFVNNLARQNRAILIKGNHEVLLQQMLDRGYCCGHDYSNGTHQTLCDMFPNAFDINEVWEAMKTDKDWVEYQSYLVDYHETDNYIFAHSWIPVLHKADNGPVKMSNYNKEYKYSYNENWRNTKVDDWDNYPYGARWVNPYKFAKNGLNQTGKTIVSGHWHCSTANADINPEELEEFPPKDNLDYLKDCFQIYKSKDLIMIDACTAYTGLVNVLTLSNTEV